MYQHMQSVIVYYRRILKGQILLSISTFRVFGLTLANQFNPLQYSSPPWGGKQVYHDKILCIFSGIALVVGGRFKEYHQKIHNVNI